MSIFKIEENLKNLISLNDHKNFIFDFLSAFEQPKTTISRLRNGDYNLSSRPNELIWKKKLYFYHTNDNEDVHEYIDSISKNIIITKNSIRFIIVTDFKDFLSIDTKSNETLDISFSEIAKNLNFFLPLTGVESFKSIEESPADRKAAISIGKLYDRIILDNKNLNREDLNLFFSRLLFLYYADDANIFEKDLFLKTLKETTNESGSDFDIFLNTLFKVLDSKDRKNASNYFMKFPYVNGYLFKDKISLPKFNKTTRDMIINNALMDWQNINPDILGSMLQSVVSPEERDEDEMHYTSVPNILKVIKPLFLDDLENKIEKAENNEKKLSNILKYLYNLKIFDPACGSGNFLIISYIQLSLIEIKIFKKLYEINPNNWKLSMPGISLNQFYGIEKSNYATQTAKLALWISSHQMKIKFFDIFGRIEPSLPIVNLPNIINDNAANINWKTLCSVDKYTSNIFLIGNPPYKGFSRQTIYQKQDIEKNLSKVPGHKRLDYITLWFYKAKEFITSNNISFCSFVSTNSICQGEHVNLFWPTILDELDITFAVKSFPWGNNAKNNAVVSCVIIGLALKSTNPKYIYDGSFIEKCNYINPYLSSKEFNDVSKRNMPFCASFPRMIGGNMPYDGGFLKFNDKEHTEIINKYPNTKSLFRKLIGGSEFINGQKRWVLWLNDKNLDDAMIIPELSDRITKVRNFRKNSGEVAQSLLNKSHQFRFTNEAKKNFILIPYTSTKDRSYLPIGFIDREYIVLNSAIVIFDPPLFIFGLLSSRTHFLWVLQTSGKMKNDIRYSSSLCYNTFPVEIINDESAALLEQSSLDILDVREKFSEQSISKLYSKNMPKALLDAHKKNDEIVDKLIFGDNIPNDEKKISTLFDIYNKLNKKGSLI